MLLIIISVIIHTLMLLVEKESKREGIDMFSYWRLMHNSAKKKKKSSHFKYRFLRIRKLEPSHCWAMQGLAGRTRPWEYLPGEEYQLLLLELLPTVHHQPPCPHLPVTVTVPRPPLPRLPPSTDKQRGRGIVLLWNETMVQIPIVFRTSGLPMQGSQGHSSTREQFWRSF